MAGEIKLVMESNDLDGPGAVEPLTKEEARFRNVSILKRKTNDNATRQKAREIHRDLFAQMPPDEQDALVATFRENLGARKAARWSMPASRPSKSTTPAAPTWPKP